MGSMMSLGTVGLDLSGLQAAFTQAEQFELQLAIMTQIHQEKMAVAQDILDTAKQDIRG
jgi:hypothetical protein